MKLYRTIRYGSTGRKHWERLSTTTGRYAATIGDMRWSGGGKVTLEVMEIDEAQFRLIKTSGKTATDD